MVVLICGWQVDVPVARDMVLRTEVVAGIQVEREVFSHTFLNGKSE